MKDKKSSPTFPFKALSPFCCCRKKPDTQFCASAHIPSVEEDVYPDDSEYEVKAGLRSQVDEHTKAS